MKASEGLMAAKAMIDSPEKWTTGAMSRDINGNPVPLFGDDACQFCSLGAIYLTTDKYDPISNTTNVVWWDYLYQVMESQSIRQFNDCHTHDEVMNMWDKAIELAKKDEQNETK